MIAENVTVDYKVYQVQWWSDGKTVVKFPDGHAETFRRPGYRRASAGEVVRDIMRRKDAAKS